MVFDLLQRSQFMMEKKIEDGIYVTFLECYGMSDIVSNCEPIEDHCFSSFFRNVEMANEILR